MIPTKKTLKLSRNHGQKLEKADTPLDDSLDDFIVTRPVRAERKAAKNNSASSSKLANEQQGRSIRNKASSSLSDEPLTSQSSSESVSVNSEQLSSSSQCSLCSKTLSDLEEETHVCQLDHQNYDDQKTLLSAGDLQSKYFGEPLGSRRQQPHRSKVTERRTTRRRAADPCDLSLALALSESLQSANESARQKEEELLLTENLAEVISDLRKEEQSTGTLSYVFPKPPDAPVTKVKRKAKATTKREPAQYTLALRSQTERERLIADRAASILSQEPDDPLQPPKSSFTHQRPTSEFLQQYFQDERPLWQRTSLHDVSRDDQSDVFYVNAFRSIISPQKKKSGYTNILLHVSQLPGRNSTQMDPGGLSNTQAMLEDLAFAAEGGFLDEPNSEENVTPASGPKAIAVNRLTEDFSQLVDNPLMSDFIIRTKNRNIWAHRLVFTVRFPSILNCVDNENGPKEKPTLDWSSFSASSVIRVLRFIYSASYEHDEEDARHVYRIACLHRMNCLLDFFPRQYDNDFVTTEEDTEDDCPKMDLTRAHIPKIRERTPSPVGMSEISLLNVQSLLPEPFANENQERKETEEVSIIEHRKSFLVHQEEISILEETTKSQIESPRKSQRVEITTSINDLSAENRRSGKSVMSSVDMEISSNTADRVVPLSPDMFEETLSDSDEEEANKSPDDVIDLTQETNSDPKSQDRSASPFGGSCEKDDSSIQESDNDVSMAECSMNLSPPNRLLKSSTDSFLQSSVLEKSVASCSRGETSFVKESAYSWNCSPGAFTDDFPDYHSPLAVPVPSPRVKSPEQQEPPGPTNQSVVDEFDEFPDELDSIFPQAEDKEFSPLRTAGPSTLASRIDEADNVNTPEPRLAKKRKIDVTPLPDYQSMETPLLKQELVKYGLKPLKRSNAVKLLHHIYEELHPLVTDSESSFQDTPDRPRAVTVQRTQQQSKPSPSKSLPGISSQEEDESDHSQEDEESMIVMELDREIPDTQSDSPRRSIPLKDRMKEFLKKRPDIYKLMLTYEPISFEFLFKEVRKERIRCKAQELLDWLDEECITCRMKNNRTRPTNRADEEEENPKVSPPKKVPSTKPAPKARRVAKKLIP